MMELCPSDQGRAYVGPCEAIKWYLFDFNYSSSLFHSMFNWIWDDSDFWNICDKKSSYSRYNMPALSLGYSRITFSSLFKNSRRQLLGLECEANIGSFLKHSSEHLSLDEK